MILFSGAKCPIGRFFRLTAYSGAPCKPGRQIYVLELLTTLNKKHRGFEVEWLVE